MSNQADLRVIEGQGQGDIIGQTIDDRYLIQRVLGEGGMGLVYQAQHVVLGKPLAIKVLRPEVSRDGEIMARFRQEAQSASGIGNQHIIDISDFGTLSDGSTYFVMEFLGGQSLTDAIEAQAGMEPDRVVHIARQLCLALGAAHAAGIVHRDLKPDNVQLIERSGDKDFVKVLDFGIAKVGGNSSKLTRAGQVFGTPHYMSPEQCAGTGVDSRTDIYALGVILYEMVTGSVPFDADNLMGILTKHLYEEPVPPKQIKADIPDELEAVILRAMAKSLDDRYQTMEELLADLEHLHAGRPPADSTTSFRHRIDLKDGGSKTKFFVIGGVAMVLVLGGVAAFAMGGEPEPEPVAVAPVEEPVVVEPVVAAPVAAEPEPVAVKEVPKVKIVSDPEGAEVWKGNELLGNTPLDVPKPEGGEKLDLQLRKLGYREREFAISSATLGSEVRFTLRKESSGRRSTRPRATGSSSPASGMKRSGPGSEVIDPWN